MNDEASWPSMRDESRCSQPMRTSSTNASGVRDLCRGLSKFGNHCNAVTCAKDGRTGDSNVCASLDH